MSAKSVLYQLFNCKWNIFGFWAADQTKNEFEDVTLGQLSLLNNIIL